MQYPAPFLQARLPARILMRRVSRSTLLNFAYFSTDHLSLLGSVFGVAGHSSSDSLRMIIPFDIGYRCSQTWGAQ